jgi:hypothetical protein
MRPFSQVWAEVSFPRADEVNITNRVLIKNPEGVEPLGRKIYASIGAGAELSRGGKKQVMRFNKGAMVRRDLVGEFSHGTK